MTKEGAAERDGVALLAVRKSKEQSYTEFFGAVGDSRLCGGGR